ncbi:MAG: hypothetical protein KA369_03685 [Spirochaetes bacterium]|nr:hypothetical protein [Spirochaetota bacterium]
MYIAVTLDDFQQYCTQTPPSAKSFDDEIKKIKEDLRGYPKHKMQYLQFYINENPWIKFYLYLDQSALKEIKDIESSAIKKDKAGHNLKSLIMEQIDDNIQKAGGIVNYLKIRIKCYFEKACGCHLITDDNEYYKVYYERNDSCEDLDVCIWFMAQLYGIINEIETIQGNNNIDNNITIPLALETKQLFVNFETIKNHQQLYNGLIAMERTKGITVNDWSKVLSGEKKIIWNRDDVDLLGFMQTLQNHGFIHDYQKKGKLHADRICKIFKPKEPRQNNDNEYDPGSLASQYSRGRKADRFYHESMHYFEKVLKIPTT